LPLPTRKPGACTPPARRADGRARARQALGEAAPLRATHRLDAATCGLVVLGRTPAFVAGFNRLLAAEGPPRAVRKLYRALCAAPPPLGAPALTPFTGSHQPVTRSANRAAHRLHVVYPLHRTAALEACCAGAPRRAQGARMHARIRRPVVHERAARGGTRARRVLPAARALHAAPARPAGVLAHWAAVQTRAPGWPQHTALFDAAGPGRAYCELAVLSVGPAALGRRAAAAGWRGAAAWEAVVELRTGRTHQVGARTLPTLAL